MARCAGEATANCNDFAALWLFDTLLIFAVDAFDLPSVGCLHNKVSGKWLQKLLIGILRIHWRITGWESKVTVPLSWTTSDCFADADEAGYWKSFVKVLEIVQKNGLKETEEYECLVFVGLRTCMAHV